VWKCENQGDGTTGKGKVSKVEVSQIAKPEKQLAMAGSHQTPPGRRKSLSWTSLDIASLPIQN
jgi:hypothetical protein